MTVDTVTRAMEAVGRNNFLRRLKGAGRNESGIAATEFALLLPIMVTLFFGMLEISDALMASRRVYTAVNSLADLVAQERDVTTAEIDQIFTGVERMLQPPPGSTATMRVTSVIRDPADNNRIIVQWSRDSSGAAPYAAGIVFNELPDPSLVNASASLIVGEINYDHQSNLTHMFIRSPRLFEQLVTRWPRRSAEVAICGNAPLPVCVD